MKTLFLLIIILFSSMLIQAQSCKDVVYPTEGKSVIFDCCIEEVYDGNRVRFTKNDTTSIIEAISIIKSGLTLDLIPMDDYVVYKGHNYKYYAEKYAEAHQKKIAGIIVASVGLAELLTGLILLDDGNVPLPQLFIIGGVVSFSIGVPLAISGGVEESKNKIAMEKAKRSTNLSFGVTNNGLGLILSF